MPPHQNCNAHSIHSLREAISSEIKRTNTIFSFSIKNSFSGLVFNRWCLRCVWTISVAIMMIFLWDCRRHICVTFVFVDCIDCIFRLMRYESNITVCVCVCDHYSLQESFVFFLLLITPLEYCKPLIISVFVLSYWWFTHTQTRITSKTTGINSNRRLLLSNSKWFFLLVFFCSFSINYPKWHPSNKCA